MGSEFGIRAVEKQVGNSANLEALGIGKITKEWISRVEEKKARIQLEISRGAQIIPAQWMQYGSGNQALYEQALKNKELIQEYKDVFQHGSSSISNLEVRDFERLAEFIEFSYYHTQSRAKEAQATGEKILEKCFDEEGHDTKMATAAFLGQSYYVSGELDKAVHLFDIVIDEFNPVTDTGIALKYGIDPLVFALAQKGLIAVLRADCNTAFSLFEECLENA